MRAVVAAGVAAITLLSASAAQAQLPVELELRGGAAFPTEDLGATELKTGGGAGLTANVRFMPHLAAYAGWEFFRFSPKVEFGNFDVEQTGYAFGFQFQHPFYRQVGYWVRAGGLYAHVEIEDDANESAVDSDHELGWEAGGGVSIPLGEKFAFTPGVRYRSLSVDLPAGEGTVPVDLAYVTAEIGFQFSFGGRPGVSARVK